MTHVFLMSGSQRSLDLVKSKLKPGRIDSSSEKTVESALRDFHRAAFHHIVESDVV